MGVRDFFARRRSDEALPAQRALPSWYMDAFKYLGSTYGVQINQTSPGENREKIAGNYGSIVRGAYKDNGVVFACVLARMLLFAEARFLFREINEEGRPDSFRWHENLRPLDEPWPGGTTGDLLSRAEQDVSLAGSCVMTRSGSQIRRLRPDWTTVLSGTRRPDGSMWDVDAEVLGVFYQPGGPTEGRKAQFIPAERVAIYAPIPDPVMPFLGMPWLRAILPEVDADSAATSHKFTFFNNGATVNLMVRFPDAVDQIESFQEWVAEFKAEHQGIENAYKTLFLGGAGADAKTIGSTFEQMQFKSTQGAGETRIAAAAGVPPIIVGLSEGLEAATYSNYAQARRRFVDLTMRPLWRNFAGSMERLIPPPQSNSPLRRSRLWYDDRDIPALREDEAERAEITTKQAAAVRQLVDAGYDPKTVADAVASGEFSKLKHTGRPTVQVQGQGQLPVGSEGNGNGGRPQELAPVEQEA